MRAIILSGVAFIATTAVLALACPRMSSPTWKTSETDGTSHRSAPMTTV